MPTRALAAALVVPFLLVACGKSKSATQAQEPIEPAPGSGFDAVVPTEGPDVFDVYGPDPAPAPEVAEAEEPVGSVQPIGPAPWTGAFGETAVMVARTFHLEGPSGLLEHVVASSDDALYERSVELTPDGLMQVVQRMSDDVPEIRVQLDRWTLAAYDRVVILERTSGGPVHVVAEGEAIWRDIDGRLLQGQRLQFTGEIGDETPFDPAAAPEGEPADAPAEDPATDDAEDSEASEAGSTGADARDAGTTGADASAEAEATDAGV
jgi:hypothetical protein